MIAVLQGGHLSEAEVSRITSKAFQESLERLGFMYKAVEYDEDLIQKLKELKPQCCLLALHGTGAEDGVVQGLLKYLKIPYTGSGLLASSLSFNKEQSLFFAKNLGVPVLPNLSCERVEGVSEGRLKKIQDEVSTWANGFVIKPVSSGSSRGVGLFNQGESIEPGLKEAFKWGDKALIEKRVIGRELTVGIFKGKAYEPIEIRPKSGFYDIKNKYTKGATEYFIPADISEDLKDNLKKDALKIYNSFGLKTYGRVDYLVENDESEYFFMEVNTLPGGTPTSLLPMSLKHSGVSFDEMISALIEEALL
jgi:D-alanine-D-alanine ligase